MIGPANPFSQQLHQTKYRQPGETFDDYCVRYARTVADDKPHFRRLLGGLREQRILPGGRQQLAVGNPYLTTAFSCFVGGEIPDDLRGIMDELRDSMMTLRTGGGCGWNFGTLRPEHEPVRGLGPGAFASGPVSFMGIWNAGCDTIMSAGMRRGAMMGVLPVWHPDIMKFARCKRIPPAMQPLWDAVAAMDAGPAKQAAAACLQRTLPLQNFNVSVGLDDLFMEAVEHDKLYPLRFAGRSYGDIRAVDLWAAMMESNWDWAEPGVLFLSVINRMNPLRYCEEITATNPCGEQPLPPHGACLLGSLNAVKYVVPSYMRGSPEYRRNGAVGHDGGRTRPGYEFDFDLFRADARAVVRAFDNVIERTSYPLPAQRAEALAKRRMGVGVTGLANAIEAMGAPYGRDEYVAWQERILEVLRDECYLTSCDLAKEKGTFPLFDAEKWLASGYAQTLPEGIRERIRADGLRNGLLLSIAPNGTISLAADNVSSGAEPVFALEVRRLVNLAEGRVEVDLNDYGLTEFGVRGRCANEVSGAEHVAVLCSAQKYIDSSVSKTVNVRGAVAGERCPGEISFDDFKQLYFAAYKGGAKGCTTFNSNGKRTAILTERKPAGAAAEALKAAAAEASLPDAAAELRQDAIIPGGACLFNPDGSRTCEGG